MPTVERYGPQKVSQAPLPAARKVGPAGVAETTASLGGGIGDALAAAGEKGAQLAGGAMSVVDQVRAKEQADADSVAIMSANRQYAEAEHELLFAKDTGALNVQGHDTLGLRATAKEHWEAAVAKINAATLTTDKQRLRAQQDVDQRWESIGHTLDSHTLTQMNAWETAETNAAVKTAAQTAIAYHDDPRRVALELGRGEQAIRDYATRNGVGTDTRDAQIAAFQSGVHVGVVQQFLAAGDATKASIYFSHAKNWIDGDAQPQLVAALEVGTTRATAQQQADAIVAAGGTLTEQRAKAKAITDAAPDDPQAAKVREAVTGLIEHEYAIKQAADRDHEEQAAKDGAHIVDTFRDITKIPPATWAGYSLATMSSLRSYATQLTTKGHVDTDWETYYPLYTLATNEATRDKFAGVNLMEYRGALGDTEFKQLTELQGAIRKGDLSAADKLTASERQQTQIVNEGLASMGMDPTPAAAGSPTYSKANNDRVVQFRRAVREATTRVERQSGKPATDDQVQAIVDAFLTPVTPEVFHFFGANDPRRLAFETAQAQASTITDISANERRRVVAALERAHLPVTDAAILALFNKTLQAMRGDR